MCAVAESRIERDLPAREALEPTHPQRSTPRRVDSLPKSAWDKQILVEGLHMNEFIEERARLVRTLVDKADPFTKVRLCETG